jgi:hypothetical protein
MLALILALAFSANKPCPWIDKQLNIIADSIGDGRSLTYGNVVKMQLKLERLLSRSDGCNDEQDRVVELLFDIETARYNIRCKLAGDCDADQ